jgi:YggT family protein
METELILNFGLRFVWMLLRILEVMIIIVILLSWFPAARANRFTIFLAMIVGPILAWARKITPRTGMIDLSPLVAFLIINLLQAIINNLIISL